MPEGPEIRREADRIASVLKDAVIDEIYFGLPRLRIFEADLLDRTVVDVTTRGKAMLIRFDNNRTLYSHNQLFSCIIFNITFCILRSFINRLFYLFAIFNVLLNS